MFYKKPVALNRDKHKDLKFQPVKRYDFAATVQSVPLTGVEFAEAHKFYPIVFAPAEQGIMPLALLGVRKDENLFVDEQGEWDARYIPAFVRRYPFIFFKGEESPQLTLCVDEEYSGLGEEGELLFEEGNESALLKQKLEFLGNFQAQINPTASFCKKLEELGLFKEMSARAKLEDGTLYTVGGFQVVDETKLATLEGEKVEELFRSGYLGWIYAHLMSLSNMNHLINLTARKKAAEATAAAA